VVHPTRSHQLGTLANAVAYYFKSTNQNCIVRLVNRLDRDTSGLVVIAKSQYAHQQMANMLIGNTMEKYYIAIVEGKIQEDATIDLPIGRPLPESLKREVMEQGQNSITHYKIMVQTESISCLEVKLETGRTHQIRVHMCHIGHPLIGDTLYGCESNLINRQALHAYKLKFESIREGKPLEIIAELPEDMKKIVDDILSQKI
jgi:23S rRNA pseudouridine1911/1915/1917 synthase